MITYQPMYLPIPVDFLYIWQVIIDAGHDALFVGGCIRDLIINEPVHDYDLATSALPEQIMELFPHVLPTGIQHGTVTVRHHGKSIEVTTFRLEKEYRDSRRPDSVNFISRVDEDLERRDFTCNSMAYRPDLGLLDLFDGLGDLKRRSLRTVGAAAARFGEDALRMLRAVRFCAQLDLMPEMSLLVAAELQQDLIYRLSKERIASEFSRTCGTRFLERLEAFAGTGVMRTSMAALGLEVADEREMVWLLQRLLPGKENLLDLPPELNSAVGLLAVLLARRPVASAALTLEESRLAVNIRALRCSLVQDARFSAAVADQAAALLLAFAALSEPSPDPEWVRARLVAGRILLTCQLAADDARVTVVWASRLLCLLLGRDPSLDVSQNHGQRWQGLPAWLNSAACDALVDAAKTMQSNADLISVKELPVSGRDLINLGFSAGPQLGDLLENLLMFAVRRPERPGREQLLALAASMAAENSSVPPVNGML